MRRNIRYIVIIGTIAILLLGLLVGWFSSFVYPVPIGEKVDSSYPTYYKSIRGYYFISVRNPLALFNHGHFGYLDHVDPKSFIVLADNWAKDKDHVWNCDNIVEGADAASFIIDKTGLPKDKNHVYVQTDLYEYKPTDCGIDARNAEYFVFKHNGQDWSWMRDKDNVYYQEVRVDVDRNSFRPLGSTAWWVDKDWIYCDYWDSKLERCVLEKVDSLQEPLDTLSRAYHYLRNGRNVIYLAKIIARDIDIFQFEDVGFDSCRINNVLYVNGECEMQQTIKK